MPLNSKLVRWRRVGSQASVFTAATAVNDAGIYTVPVVSPQPAAGQSYFDPVFGTQIIRVTDDVNAPFGAGVASAADFCMFNANATYLYIYVAVDGVGNGVWKLASVSPVGIVTLLGDMPANTPGGKSIAYDGATWHPTNPAILYAVSQSSATRELVEIAIPAGTMTVLHDFVTEVPSGGSTYSHVTLDPTARYFGITASTTGGQDTYDYVVRWDRTLNTSVILHLTARIPNTGVGTNTGHSLMGDLSNQYFEMDMGNFASYYVWHWSTDVLSPTLTGNSPYFFGGHKVFGTGIVINPSASAGWQSRPLNNLTALTPIFSWPLKSGKVDYYEDSHSSNLLAAGQFIQTRYVSYFFGSLTLHAGAVWKITSYLANGTNLLTPDTVRYKGLLLTQVGIIPTASGQWYFDAGNDVLYVRLPDDSDPNQSINAGTLNFAIFDRRAAMEEIVQLSPVGDGTYSWRRLAHHRAGYTGAFGTIPRGNVDPTGRFVLFMSNWGAADSHSHVYLLRVPTVAEFAAGHYLT